MAKKQVQPAQLPVSRLPEIKHLPVAERFELGRTQRQATPRSAHAEWQPPSQTDPLALLAASNVGRTPVAGAHPSWADVGFALRLLPWSAGGDGL